MTIPIATAVDPATLIRVNHLFSWFSEPGSTMTDQNDILYNVIIYTCLAWFVLLMGLMGYFIVKYRRRPGVPAPRSPAHNTVLELAWSIFPLLILVVFFVWGFDGYMKQTVVPNGAEEISITGQKWVWSARYRTGKQPGDLARIKTDGPEEVPVILVPAGRPVKLIMKSVDVIHSFFVPDFRTKFDVFPNRYTSMWFEAKHVGKDHAVFCAEYCGDNHSEMAAVLRVVDQESYDAYINQRDPLKGTIAELGERLWKLRGCKQCHTLDGAPGTGPSWKTHADGQYGFGTARRFEDGSSIPAADENYLRESILYSQAHIVQGYPPSMPTYAGILTDPEVDVLIMYIKHLNGAFDGGTEYDESEAASEGGNG